MEPLCVCIMKSEQVCNQIAKLYKLEMCVHFLFSVIAKNKLCWKNIFQTLFGLVRCRNLPNLKIICCFYLFQNIREFFMCLFLTL